MAEQKPLLKRPLEAWRKCEPHAMATKQSAVAIKYGFEDAKHDILALGDLCAELIDALKVSLGALEAISDDMTVGDRWTNAGQELLDSLGPTREAVAKYSRMKA
jgi:hypothetical protein